jgi:rhamnosyltransferase
MGAYGEEPFEVTVVLRSYNDASLLPRTLASLDAQKGVRLRLFVFESGSADDSPRIIEEHGYDRIQHLEPGTYHSSTVLNQGVEWAETELVAFVNSDAILLSDDVLLKLARTLSSDERCGGAFARQRARPDATALTKLDHFVAFDHREQLGPKFDHLSLVVSMIRRSCWQQNPFDPALTYAEDYVWSERAKELGWHLAYVKDAEVEHSHDYSPEEMYRRSYGDAAAVAILSTDAAPPGPIRGVVLPGVMRLMRDVVRLGRMGQLGAVFELPRYRLAAQLGEWRGRRDAWRQWRFGVSGKQPTVPRTRAPRGNGSMSPTRRTCATNSTRSVSGVLE